MESEQQRCVRLLSALEELAAQESVCVRHRDYAAVLELQRRAAPIVAELSVADPAVTPEAVRRRVAAILDVRKKTQVQIQEHLDGAREKLAQLQRSTRQVSQIAPVYGSSAPRRGQLSVVS